VNLRTVVEGGILRSAMALPEQVQRLLGGGTLAVGGERLAADLRMMLHLQRLAGKAEFATPDIEAGRAGLRANAGLVGGDQPIGAVRELTVAGCPARHYLPRGHRPQPGPLLVFFHGGGFLYGDLDSHDAPCRLLAEQSGVPVLSVAYGLGPEHPFPTAFDDAESAVRWVAEHAEELDVDPARIGVAGDSAGGNIAAWVAIAAARAGLPLAFQLLVYPCTDEDRDTESLRLYGRGFYLTSDSIAYVDRTYLPLPEDRGNERMNLLDVALPDGLAPAHVVTAGFDPLRDEGEAYAARLEAAGVATTVRRYGDQIHGFLNIVGVGRTSRAAVLEIAEVVRDALGAGNRP